MREVNNNHKGLGNRSMSKQEVDFYPQQKIRGQDELQLLGTCVLNLNLI